MKKIVTPEVENMCYELKENGVKYKNIREKIKDELGISLSFERINYYRNKRKIELEGKIKIQESKLSDLNNLVDIEDWRYEIEGENVVFYKNIKDAMDEKITKKFSISIEELGEIVYSYSREGLNMSGRQILRKFNLNRELRSLIKSRLYITKDENACPDIVLDFIKNKYGDDAKTQKIIEVSSRAIHDKYKPERVENYDKIFKQEAERAIKILNSREEFLKLARDYIKEYKPIKLPEFKEIEDNHKTLFVAFGDLHYGRTSDELLKRLDKLKQKIIARPETNIILKCMGDVMETIVQGGMHSGQIEEQDVMGFRQLLDIAHIMEQFLIDIRKTGKTVRMDGVTGNHDRIAKLHNEDKFRMGGLMFYELLTKSLANTDIKINYTMDAVLKLIDDGMNIIQAHGDNRFDKKKSEDILNFYGEYGIHNIILEGDKHTGKFSEGKNYSRITVQSMNVGNRYSEEELMLSSEPGNVFITKNEDGKPDVTFVRL